MGEQLEFDAVARYLIADNYVVKALRRQFGECSTEIIDAVMSGKFPEFGDIHTHDFLQDLLHNDARLYVRFYARGSFGTYPITVSGLGGVYFFQAPDFGTTGYFLDLACAKEAIASNWCDSLVSANGRRYREPFENPLLELELARAKAGEAIQCASQLLDCPNSLERTRLWVRLLDGSPLDDVHLCADVLCLWVQQDLEPGERLSSVDRIVRVLLKEGPKVLRVCGERGQSYVIQNLASMAADAVVARADKLYTTTGIARMSAATSLASAERAVDIIQAAIRGD